MRFAVKVAGQFHLVGNQFQGFDLENCHALELLPDTLGRPMPNLIRDNVFQGCTRTGSMESVFQQREPALHHSQRTSSAADCRGFPFAVRLEPIENHNAGHLTKAPRGA